MAISYNFRLLYFFCAMISCKHWASSTTSSISISTTLSPSASTTPTASSTSETTKHSSSESATPAASSMSESTTMSSSASTTPTASSTSETTTMSSSASTTPTASSTSETTTMSSSVSTTPTASSTSETTTISSSTSPPTTALSTPESTTLSSSASTTPTASSTSETTKLSSSESATPAASSMSETTTMSSSASTTPTASSTSETTKLSSSESATPAASSMSETTTMSSSASTTPTVSSMSETTTMSSSASTTPTVSSTSETTAMSSSASTTPTASSTSTSQPTTATSTSETTTLSSPTSPTATVKSTSEHITEVSSILDTTPTTSTFESTTIFSSATRTTITTTSTTPRNTPTTTPPNSFTVDLGGHSLSLNFSIRVNLTFDNDYKNKTSKKFEELDKDFTYKLTQIYRNTSGFKYVEIREFGNGSVTAYYSVIVSASTNLTEVMDYIKTTVIDQLGEVMINGSYVDIGCLNQTMNTSLYALNNPDICKLSTSRLCPYGFKCSNVYPGKVFCTDYCNDQICVHGTCYIDHLDESILKCRCPIDDNGYVYSGDRCQNKDFSTLIIITSAVGGAVFIAAFIIICLICFKLRRNTKRSNDILLNNIPNYSKYFPRDSTYQPQYGYDLPVSRRNSRESRDLDGIPRYFPASDDGQENMTYFHERQDAPSVDYGGDPIRERHTYDYIGIDTKFEIRRPRLR